MKKILVVCVAVLLPCFLVSAQEADDTGTGVGLSVIPRLDLSPEYSDGSGQFTLGNSSLYSLFEGDITERLSVSVCNHWLSSSPKELYKIEGEGANFLRSDWTNWLDWAYLTYSIGNFSFSFGKDMVTVGGLEFDDYDFEVHTPLCSSLWQNFSCYQWGGKFGYTTPSESTYVGLQVTTSPYGERPFQSGLYNYSLEWRGNYFDWLENIWSITLVDNGDESLNFFGRHMPLLSLGQRVTLGDWAVGLDYFNKVGSEETILADGTTLMPSILWSPSEKLELLAKAGYESRKAPMDPASLTAGYFAGGAIHWFPLKDSRDLRIHASGAYNSLFKTYTLTVGALYYINLFGK